MSNGADSSAISIISNKIHDRVPEMLEIKLKHAKLFEKMDLSIQSRNRIKYLDPLIDKGWVAPEFPDEKTHPNQTYVTSVFGKKILKLLNTN
jgi:ATP-dependent DNA helicase RecG